MNILTVVLLVLLVVGIVLKFLPKYGTGVVFVFAVFLILLLLLLGRLNA